jgi:hypothetical protein
MRGKVLLRAVAMLTLLAGMGCCHHWCERCCPQSTAAAVPACGAPYVAGQPVQVAQPAVAAPVTMNGCSCTCPAPYHP